MQHLAIIADGNRRWAKRMGLPIKAGYLQGLVAIENCCDWAISRNVKNLTIFCFSTENWNRPPDEIKLLKELARWYILDKCGWYVNKDIHVQFIGRRDRVSRNLIEVMEYMERETVGCTTMNLTVCVDYGGRDEIARAIASGAKTEEELSAVLSHGLPDPDVILRPGGQSRLSNFLLWQSAYSELFFTETLFPDLSYDELDTMLNNFKARKRNYGG